MKISIYPGILVCGHGFFKYSFKDDQLCKFEVGKGIDFVIYRLLL